MPERSHRPSNASVLPRGVRRALDAMRAAPGREFSVTDLAAIAGGTSRTLQRQFQIFLGKTPRAVLRDIRFECARRELLQSSSGAKVMDIALRCGLPHCGRFSIEYRRRYGETPSQTRKRQAVFTGALSSPPQLFPSGRDRPTVAVGPIEAGPENAEFACSVTDALATALTRGGVSVVGRVGSARYHLAGVLRGTAEQTRLTFRLIEAGTGRHLWAHRHDGSLGGAFAFEEQLATKIAAALQPCLRSAEIERARRKPDVDLSAHDLTLRALPHVLSLDADGNALALELLECAMERDPGHALAAALAAWAHAQRVIYHFTATPSEGQARAADLARRALALAGDATALAVLGNALTALHDLETAGSVVGKALAADGSSTWAWSRSGWIDVYSGHPESAIERFTIALELAPHDPLAFNNLVGIGCAHFHAGRYVDAARWQERALIEHPSAVWIHRTLCPAHVLSGSKSAASRSLDALRGQYPELTLGQVRQGLPPLSPTFCDLVVEGLHSIGLPA
jgi:AraC-like DNA-binding protein/tetratricopeptide (TPR) repeat protein